MCWGSCLLAASWLRGTFCGCGPGEMAAALHACTLLGPFSVCWIAADSMRKQVHRECICFGCGDVVVVGWASRGKGPLWSRDQDGRRDATTSEAGLITTVANGFVLQGIVYLLFKASRSKPGPGNPQLRRICDPGVVYSTHPTRSSLRPILLAACPPPSPRPTFQLALLG